MNSQRTGITRTIVQRTQGIPASDGDGVKLTRIIGSQEINMIDPFLLLDAFSSNDQADYIGGFPDHPHRGFETVTYLLAGRMRHKDNAGHEGVIEAGGVQWMSAGRGIVHSEMPEQEDGLLKGFQLWVNLPSTEKMTAPKYQEFPASEIPVETMADVGTITVIAGTTDAGTTGPVKNSHTDPIYLDIQLSSGAPFQQTVPTTLSGFIYVITGNVKVGEDDELLGKGNLGVLSDGDRVHITCVDDSRFLLIAGKQLNEPVARGGPFVMNTKQEIQQAFQDYQHGRF